MASSSSSAAASTASSHKDDRQQDLRSEREDDDWSRRVETDENAPSPDRAMATAAAMPAPPQPAELTMKEKMVLRERQRRVETERARLKRQFAMMSNGTEDDTGEPQRGEDGSVQVTVGDGSSLAQAELLEEESQKLGYTMERFLQQQQQEDDDRDQKVDSKPPDKGVVMERFLNQPVVVVDMEASNDAAAAPSRIIQDHQRTVSFEREPSTPPPTTVHPPTEQVLNGNSPARAGSSLRSFSDHSNASTPKSVEVEGVEDLGRASSLHSQPSSEIPEVSDSPYAEGSEQPRVLRLTEAEIQEMAAIEEASIGNAPPSDREDDSFSGSSMVGEMVGDFGGPTADPALSQGTLTTAQESTQPSDHEADSHSLDGIRPPSVSSQLVLSPDASAAESASLRVNPPSEIAGEAALSSTLDGELSPRRHPSVEEHPTAALAPMMDLDPSQIDTAIVNRRIRPGMVATPQRRERPSLPQIAGSGSSSQQSRMKRSASLPENIHNIAGFDFDKDNPVSPRPGFEDSLRELIGEDSWSPGGKMILSPIVGHNKEPPVTPILDEETGGAPRLVHFGPPSDTANAGTERQPLLLQMRPQTNHGSLLRTPDEKTSLIPKGLPDEIHTTREKTTPRRLHDTSLMDISMMNVSIVDTVFSDIRSESEGTLDAIQGESEFYANSSVFARAIPERLFALFVTMLVEIPVLLMVSGGSDRLCMLIGRTRYQLLMGFLPLSSAISGNVGLQASTLTTRAISHDQVTKQNYLPWLCAEVGAAVYLGLGMGLMLGGLAYVASGWDLGFGVTIMFAQFISILTAGLTGTFAPLLFSFIFHRDAGKWGGPLETAIQDIIGSFAMVVISYHILKVFGPIEIDADDVCGSGNTNYDISN